MATLILLVAGLDWSTGNPSATGIEVIVPRILASIFILVGAGAIAFAVVFAIGGTRRTDFTD